jgi:nucleotide-binding universal stress UspA family protein
MNPNKILVPVDFTPSSDAALDYALAVADSCGAEVEMLYVWRPREHDPDGVTAIFADTPEGRAMEQRLSAAESVHAARLSGRLEFGADPARVIVGILERERFDMVVVSRVAAPSLVGTPGRCLVVTVPPRPPGETEAA